MVRWGILHAEVDFLKKPFNARRTGKKGSRDVGSSGRLLRYLIERSKKAANELRKVSEFRLKMRSAGEKTRERALEKTAADVICI